MESDLIEDVNEDLCDVTKVSDNTFYVTLTKRGIESELESRGHNQKDISFITKLIDVKELEQQKALINYLKLEQELKGSIVYVMLRDGRTDTDEDLFKDTYCLPLNTFFSCLSEHNFKPVRTDIITPSTNIVKEEYPNYLFNNESFSKLLSVFIDVGLGGDR